VHRGASLPQTLSPPEPAATELRPLCVDLDGTLVKSDTLIDSLLVLARTRPACFFRLPGRLVQGKAAFKAYVTEQVTLDVAHLPYNRKLLQFLLEERGRGRALYLTTGADTHLAQRVADHVGIFNGVLGSDGTTNLTGEKKLDRLQSRLGSGAFDYVGNDAPDLPLLARAAEPLVANPSLRLRRKLRARGIRPGHTFEERGRTLDAMVKALRPHQWAKNLLIFLPLLLAHVVAVDRLLAALLAFCCFSLAASATYIVNDLLDIEADRRHPAKRLRPFAAGDLPAFAGLGIVTAFLLLAFCGARLLPIAFVGWLLLYLFCTLAYSLYLKRVALVDVLVLSGLYTLRLLAGSAATRSHISPWLAGFSVFLFFSLAIVKRFAELENLRASSAPPRNGRGYLVADLDQLRSFGTSSAFAAVMVFAIYISSSDVVMLYQRPEVLWLIMPLMILWLCRVWLRASRGSLDEDPLVFALTDRMSLLIGAAVAAIVLLAI
jgi:4-hydroxybenzoate polyprenyltransferase/phosphoserine phosphatase